MLIFLNIFDLVVLVSLPVSQAQSHIILLTSVFISVCKPQNIINFCGVFKLDLRIFNDVVFIVSAI